MSPMRQLSCHLDALSGVMRCGEVVISHGTGPGAMPGSGISRDRGYAVMRSRLRAAVGQFGGRRPGPGSDLALDRLEDGLGVGWRGCLGGEAVQDVPVVQPLSRLAQVRGGGVLF